MCNFEYLSSGSYSCSDLYRVQGIVISLSFSVGINVGWILPGLK
jgi:hypothetical protein